MNPRSGSIWAAALLALIIPAAAQAAPIIWTDWTAADAASATGTMGGITVGFSGAISPPAQTAGGGTNYWTFNSAIYTSVPEVDNPPPDSDIVRLTGGTAAGTQTITFSSPVTNPVMAILSLGQPSLPRTYDFVDENFDVLNSGNGHWGGNAAGSLFEDPGNVLRGVEGHGIIQFIGTFTSIDWTIPLAENWHGFQIGMAAAAPPVPEPATLVIVGGGLAIAMVRARRKTKR
jgi:hypothetical protein